MLLKELIETLEGITFVKGKVSIEGIHRHQKYMNSVSKHEWKTTVKKRDVNSRHKNICD